MAEEYRFFNHIDGDRQYNADEFAEYFRQVLTNGILNGGTNLQVYCSGADRIARIKPGKAWLEGYFYKLTDELELPLAEAHGTYDRIDRIVVRLDRRPEARHIRAFVLTGEPAMEPVAPALTREGLVYEISLAQVLVVHNTSVLQPGNVTDERLDASVCGLVNSLVQVDAAHMTQQWEQWYGANTDRWEQDWDSWYGTNTAQWQQEWEDWFAGIQGQNYIPASEKSTPNGVATLDAEGKVPVSQLPDLDFVPTSAVGEPGGVAKQDDFIAHKAEDATQAHLAKNIGLEDAGNHFAASNVEGALVELFTSVDSGKQQLETAVIDKKGTVSKAGAVATFAELDAGIRGIPTGGAKVQRGVISLQSQGSVDVPISEVDVNKAVVLTTYSSAGITALEYEAFTAEIVNSTTLRLSRYESHANTYPVVAWQVVEFEGLKSLQKGSRVFSGTTSNISISSVDISKAFVIATTRASSSATRLEYLRVHAELSSSTQLILHKVNLNGTVVTAWQVIEFE